MSDLKFFSDGVTDRVLGVLMELAEEVHTLRCEVRSLQGVPLNNDIDRQDAFVARLLAPLTYETESPAPVFEAP
jgi:hypothetical protein